MVRLIKRGFVTNFRDFVHAFKSFNHNTRAHLISVALQAFGGGMIATVFALYIKSAQLGESTVGYVEGAFSIGTAVIALVGPPLVSALGYRAPMAVALGLLAVSRFAQGAAPLPMMLIALGLAIGLGDGLLRTTNAAYMSEQSTHDVRSHLFSAEFLLRMLAVFAGGLVGGFVPGIIGGDPTAGFQWTISAGSVLMALGIVPMLFMREKIHGIRGFWRVQLKTAREFSAWGHLGRLAAPQAFLAGAAGLTVPFVPLYLNHALGASVAQIGLIQGFSSLVVGLCAFGVPLLSRKLGSHRSIMALQIAALPLLLAVPVIGSLSVGVVALVSRSTLMGVAGPLWGEASMTGVKAADKPYVSGGLLFMLSAMSFVGNIAGGAMMEISYTAPYIPASILWAAGAALTWLLWIRPAKAARAVEYTGPIALPASAVAEAA